MRNLLIFICLSIFIDNCEKTDLLYNSKGITFTKVTGDFPDYKLNGNIVSYEEIVGYDSIQHIFLLTDNAGERIRKEKYPVTPTRFAIALDGKLIYLASFIPGYSSISCNDCICVEPYSYDNKYRIDLGYRGPDLYSGTDPRNDNRIILRLKKDNKLTDISN
jgi:hypothetical protein